ncbi:unnamed protein product [Heligmosomoides polygyrus]|uniref:DUF615 domain-containing protein n=1 Tax=Heligmosomoides polygyrus TaxID=6339 RepID=A0A3P8G069_HELPZ|nr:unnamed protein product [Heligmosomoides polygyrus]
MPSIRRDRRIIRRSASEPLEPDAMFARMPSIGEDRRRGIRRPASEPLDSSDDIRFYRYGEAKRKLERLIGRDSISEQLRGLKMLLGFVPKHQELPHVLEHVNQLRGERKKTFMCYLSPSEYS